nr:unnamed protein product [Spirometra erinaceieuropaei]
MRARTFLISPTRHSSLTALIPPPKHGEPQLGPTTPILSPASITTGCTPLNRKVVCLPLCLKMLRSISSFLEQIDGQKHKLLRITGKEDDTSISFTLINSAGVEANHIIQPLNNMQVRHNPVRFIRWERKCLPAPCMCEFN